MQELIITDVPESEVPAGPKDFRAVLAVSTDSDVYVIDTTEDCDAVDLFANGTAPDDNCIEPCVEMQKPGMYYVRLNPWTHRTYEGDYDFGIRTTLIACLGQVPEHLLDTLEVKNVD